MGMYNEVYKSCAECGARCEVQIHQIVLGFGEFNLDDPEDIADKLTESQIHELRDALSEKTFSCDNCTWHFSPFKDAKSKYDIAEDYFGKKT